MLMRDVYPVTVLVGYQFSMRWMNAHIFYVKRASPLAKRILEITSTMPLNHPDFQASIVDRVGCSQDGLILPLTVLEPLVIVCIVQGRPCCKGNNPQDA